MRAGGAHFAWLVLSEPRRSDRPPSRPAPRGDSMSSRIRPANPLSRYLADPLRAGPPAVAGALAVFPVFGRDPQLGYLAFSQALPRGFMIQELDHAASVNDLLVDNTTDEAVLLYEG